MAGACVTETPGTSGNPQHTFFRERKRTTAGAGCFPLPAGGFPKIRPVPDSVPVADLGIQAARLIFCSDLFSQLTFGSGWVSVHMPGDEPFVLILQHAVKRGTVSAGKIDGWILKGLQAAGHA
ncbi:hypothetical protein CJP46_07595 [Paenibacillus sp. XY044]|nr:hypothetical protein CJP46_07595 [Paenibacillus sp. XY044]